MSILGAVKRDEELQAMQMYGAEDAEDLAMILDHLDKSLTSSSAAPERRLDASVSEVNRMIRRRSNYRTPHAGEDLSSPLS